MKWLLTVGVLLLVPSSTAQESFHIPPDGPKTAALWMHMTNDGTPLRGGNDSTTIGYMNVRRPLEPSILVGRSLGPTECPAPPVLPQLQRPTWQVGISPDRIPLPSDENYNHYHWNEATMDFTLLRGLDLTWYAGIAGTGPAGELLPLSAPVEAVLQADLVVAHTDVADGIDDVVDQTIASGRSTPVLLAGQPLGSADSIEVDGFAAYRFDVRLNLTDGEVRSWPGSSVQLWLTLRLTNPQCGGSLAIPSASPFAATDPSNGDEGLSVLYAITDDPIRVDRVEIRADRYGGLFTALLRSPWGESDVEYSLHAQVDDVVLDDILQMQPRPAEHEDFHPLFNGNYTWSWKANATGPGVFDIIARTSTGSAGTEVYVPFDVPRHGVVHCVMEPPEPAVCTTEAGEAEVPGLPTLLLVGLLFAAARVRR